MKIGTENIQNLARIYSSYLCENLQRKIRFVKNILLDRHVKKY